MYTLQGENLITRYVRLILSRTLTDVSPSNTTGVVRSTVRSNLSRHHYSP